MSRLARACGALLTAATLAACGSTAGSSATTTASPEAKSSGSAVSHGGPVRDHVSLVDKLRARGVKVDVRESVHQPFLRPAGTVLGLSGAGITKPAVIQSYNYDETDLGT